MLIRFFEPTITTVLTQIAGGKMKLHNLLFALLGLVILSCEESNNNSDPNEELILIGSASENGLSIDLFKRLRAQTRFVIRMTIPHQETLNRLK